MTELKVGIGPSGKNPLRTLTSERPRTTDACEGIGIGGVIVVFSIVGLDKLKIDDVVGAIPVHLFAGIWGTIAVVFYTPDTSLMVQLTAIAAYGVFTFVAAGALWLILKATVGIRVSAEAEMTGLDKAELGMEAYPDFTNG